jgi:hypothetical protein
MGCARVIAKVHRPWQHKPQGEGTSGIVRITRCRRKMAIDRDQQTNATGGLVDGNLIVAMTFSPLPRRVEKPMLGGEL